MGLQGSSECGILEDSGWRDKGVQLGKKVGEESGSGLKAQGCCREGALGRSVKGSRMGRSEETESGPV